MRMVREKRTFARRPDDGRVCVVLFACMHSLRSHAESTGGAPQTIRHAAGDARRFAHCVCVGRRAAMATGCTARRGMRACARSSCALSPDARMPFVGDASSRARTTSTPFSLPVRARGERRGARRRVATDDRPGTPDPNGFFIGEYDGVPVASGRIAVGPPPRSQALTIVVAAPRWQSKHHSVGRQVQVRSFASSCRRTRDTAARAHARAALTLRLSASTSCSSPTAAAGRRRRRRRWRDSLERRPTDGRRRFGLKLFRHALEYARTGSPGVCVCVCVCVCVSV